MFFTSVYWILLLVDFGLFSENVHEHSKEEEPTSYDGARVYRALFREPKDIVTVKNLLDQGVINSMWSLTPARGEFLVRSENIESLRRTLTSEGINHSLIMKDVQKRIDPDHIQSTLWTETSLRDGHRVTWTKYPSREIIDEYLQYLKDNFPSTCNVKVIGYTENQLPIKVIKISNGNPTNKGFVITAGFHGREWVAITSALYIADEIIHRFDSQPHFMKDIDWYIMPLMNPDGYDFSQTKDRFWRKNRRKFGMCYGVDVNRNFNIDWDVPGITESNVCSEAYSGPKAFSEAESQSLQAFVKNLRNIPSALVDIHSYGQQILYPWCARTEDTAHTDLHKRTATGMAKAIEKEDKKVFTFGSAYHLMYPASGAAIDWAYQLGINHSYAIEARDKGANGFLLPPTLILDTGKEMYQGIKHLASVINSKDKRQRSSWL